MELSEQIEASIRTWIDADYDPETKAELRSLLERSELGEATASHELLTRFTRRLVFGTAGIRGPIRGGPTGMNRLVVCQTTAGLSSFLLKHRAHSSLGDLRVVVGCDARTKSDLFQQDTLEVLSGYGIEAIEVPERLPTPVLAFAVKHLNADAGVMITASHNPPADNGYKVYLGGSDQGSQIIPPVDREIESCIEEISHSLSFSTIPRSDVNVSALENKIVTEYITSTLRSLNLAKSAGPPIEVVYTPLHGVGGETFLDAVEQAGFPPLHIVEEQFEPDPDFPTVAFPNPEEPGALDLSFAKAQAVDADLIIAHDPDADRLAVAVPDSTASQGFRALTGNQVGAILGWYLAERAHLSGSSGSLANSLVSSPVLGKIAQHFGLDHEETLTGFKYVSRVENLIFGFEEALGYLVTPDVVRDKDGISAGLLVMSLANSLGEHGKTLVDYLREVEEQIGAFESGQVTIRLSSGVAGSTITTSLRERELSALGSRSVTLLDDFLEGVGNFPKEDILRYYLDDGTRVIARPSGTEPKVKVYIDTEGETSAEAQSRLTEVESDINELVSSL